VDLTTGSESDGRPRYQRLAAELLGDIRRGRLKVGATLPGELELVERYKVSRHTVREALRRLGELGLIERQQGVGTIVKARHSTESYVHTVHTPAELLRYPPDCRLVVVESGPVKATRPLARLLQCRAGQVWHRVSAVRRFRSARPPLCWTEIYLVPEYAEIAGFIGRRAQLVYELVEHKFGERVTSVRVEIGAGLVPAEHAEALETAPGTPALTIVRRYAGRNRKIFQVTVSEHPADRYAYELDLKRGWRSGAAWTAA
jgi:DNA-binding GntR family transcriptional regulator